MLGGAAATGRTGLRSERALSRGMPVTAGDGSFAVALGDFCTNLRLLREQAGGPSVVALGADGDVPLRRSQIHDVLAGRISAPPTWDFVQMFVSRCRAYALRADRRASISTDLEWWRREHAFLTDLMTRSRRTATGRRPTVRGPATVLTDQQLVVCLVQPTPDGGRRQVGVITGDIRQVRCADAWINSENTDMHMARVQEASISAIIRYEGSVRDVGGRLISDDIVTQLESQVGHRRPLAPASVVVTGAGQLESRNNVRHVIHVAAVHGEPGSGFQPIKDLARCVDNALVAAEQLDGCRVVLFPLLGTGVGGAPVESAARKVIHAAVSYLRSAPSTRLSTVLFLAYTDLELRACQRALATADLLALRGDIEL